MDHHTEIESTETGYTAICSCGYSGVERGTRWAAAEDNKTHLEALQRSGEISDGYHTFDELYAHRIELFITVCRLLSALYFKEEQGRVWRSPLHSDGTSFEGWFVLGIGIDPGQQITYHLPLDRWNDCDFATERSIAPKFDGHTPADVLERLKTL